MKVLIDLPIYEQILTAIKSLPGVEVMTVAPEEKVRPLPVELIEEVDALLCTFPPENHQDMKALKYVQIASAGFTQLIGQGLEDRGVACCNALGVFDVPIAEWNVAMMVNLARDMRRMLHHQDSGIWDRSKRFQHEIRGSVVGIWGYGGIGRETARLAKAMGMTVHVLSRSGVKPRKDIYNVEGTGDPEGVLPDRVFLSDEKEAFLKGLDFLVLAMPQTGSSEGIVSETELRMMKKEAFLLNPARGPLVQEQALLKALNEGWIAGAALDTHYYYPMPADHPLWKMPNVIITPHISGSSSSPNFLERVYDIFYLNILRLQQAEPLLNELKAADLKSNHK
ncbi:MAG TPA: D-2-hydroxyacid dehydrogenase [Pedobacter sp.]|uniref:D-2-hydroxyacid dehydrogenase n=1 Tax=Pedobacter sp. TaxID=1411316 RepID=UPI002BE12817|nr:D-2-hydroxyacid dehydrogenase [Pedobacter sp.]HMI01922.1 D-2-hydroxyacid dehydrogenase [Pedobacter sp.]